MLWDKKEGCWHAVIHQQHAKNVDVGLFADEVAAAWARHDCIVAKKLLCTLDFPDAPGAENHVTSASSKWHGVAFHKKGKGKWGGSGGKHEVRCQGFYFGYRTSAIEAARAHDEFALFHGIDCKMNFRSHYPPRSRAPNGGRRARRGEPSASGGCADDLVDEDSSSSSSSDESSESSSDESSESSSEGEPSSAEEESVSVLLCTVTFYANLAHS